MTIFHDPGHGFVVEMAGGKYVGADMGGKLHVSYNKSVGSGPLFISPAEALELAEAITTWARQEALL